MKIDLHADTTNMTRDERLAVRLKIKEALDGLNHELNTMAKAEHLHLGCVEPNIFFDITFNFETMSKEELQSLQKSARRLMANFQRQMINPKTHQDGFSNDFFGKTFDFSKMSEEELLEGQEKTKVLLRKITEQLVIVEKLERLSGQGESTKV